MNCFKFCKPRRQDQSAMLSQQMEINVEYLQDEGGNEHGFQSIVQL